MIEGGYDVLAAEEFAAIPGDVRCQRCDHFRHEHGVDPSDPDGERWPFQCIAVAVCPCMEFLKPYPPEGDEMKHSSAAAAVAAPAGPAEPVFRMIPLAGLRESAFNPRKLFDPVQLADLEASIREKGVITPLIVREIATHPSVVTGAVYEIAAGHRRARAARAAGLGEVPAIVREMDDNAFLEVLVIENDQRQDVHALEEAAGYKQLMLKAGYSAARIAERTGRSEKYVYDRIKLLDLVDEAAELFLDGRFTPAHAILLARLKPEDQKRAIGTKAKFYDDGGLLTQEDFVVYQDRSEKNVHAVSVREFEAWINETIRLDLAAPDPMLFPQAAATMARVQETAEKVVHITSLYRLDDAKDGAEKVFVEGQWKRADGEQKSKACAGSVTGVIVVGPGRGSAFKVCIDRKGCRVHWSAEIRQAKEAARDRSTPGAAAASARGAEEDRWKREAEKQRLESERRRAEEKRWAQARPAILEAVSSRLKKLPIAGVGRVVLEALEPNRATMKALAQYVDFHAGADGLLRSAAFLALHEQLTAWDAVTAFPRVAAAIGINVKATIAAVVEPEKKAAPPKGKTGSAEKAGNVKKRRPARAQASA